MSSKRLLLGALTLLIGCGGGGGDDAPPGDDTPATPDAQIVLVSACFGEGCPLGECASLAACDTAGYNSGGFDWDDSNQFCGGTPADLCIEYDGTLYHVSCAGLTVIKDSCFDGCAYSVTNSCAYCAEDGDCP